MSRYELWVFLHVASVIVWLGAGTTLVLISLYAQRVGDTVLLERLTGLLGWLGQRVVGPAALGALVFGIVADRSGDWSSPLWIRLGYGAIAISLLLNIGVRAPLLRRIRHGATASGSAGRLLRALPLVELTVLYLAVADMVAKPTGSDTGSLAAGGAVLGLAVTAALAAVRARLEVSS
jgi:cyanate permease